MNEITPTEIQQWLDDSPHSREWLAEQTGTSPGTVANWLAANKPRPIPPPTLKLIERLMCDDILGEPQYSYAEAKMIRNAMAQGSYVSLREFVRDAVISNAAKLLAPNAPPKLIPLSFPEMKVADDDVQYKAPIYAKSDIQAAAGSPLAAEVVDWDGEGDTVLVKIIGDSMSPKIKDGDVVPMKHKRASRNPFMKKGLIYLVEYDGGYTVKRYNTRPAKPEEIGEEWVENGKVKVLESINQDYPEIIIKQSVEWAAWLE